MTQRYTRLLTRCLGLLLALVASGVVARAQSGPYGNEWIVPTQTYYKIKVTQDGIYRLDYTYLTQAGLSGAVNPQRLQLWRRGQQVARYIGGNRTQLDATTYVEFFGQRNDGKLDRDMYLAASHQPHQLYSLFTDTAAYFLTVSATANGRDMAENTSAAGTVHANWLQQNLILDNGDYNYGQTDQQVAFLPWADTGEGFLGGAVGETRPPYVLTGFAYGTQTMSRLAPGGAQAWLDYVVVGAYPNPHSTVVSVLPGGTGAPRVLGVLNYGSYDVLRTRLALQRSDFGTTNSLRIRQEVAAPVNPPTDKFRVGYARVMYPQTAHWKAGRQYFQFWNDSTLAGGAYYELDSIPATVYGYNVADPYNVQRVSSASLSATRRGFSFPGTVGRMRALVLADAAQPLAPAAAQAMRFRSINAASHNFIIVSNAALMRRTGTGQVNPVREYATYRASAAGGRHDTLVVTSDQLYDQFHYGERSPLAIKHFANYLLASPRANRYLLLLGKGVLITESAGGFYRQTSAANRAVWPDLVPTSTRGASDIFFTADWQNGSYVPRIPTGRIPAVTSQQVLNYLDKLKQYEALGAEPWRKNILHMAGGHDASEFTRFQSFLRGYQRKAEMPFFGANVENIYNTTPLVNGGVVSVDITPQLRKGLSLITYFGHGSTNYLDLLPTSINDPGSNYPSGGGKYPVFYVNGCAAGNTYTTGGSIAEDWLLIANKGIIGFLADSDFGLENDQDRFCNQMYSALFNEPNWYGKSVAAVQAEVARRMSLTIPPAADNQGRRYYLSLLMNLTWQGDPALSLFAPEKPDYKFTPNATAARVDDGAGPVLANMPTFRLKLQLSNPGKIVTDSVRITVERTLNGTPLPGKVEKLHYYLRDTTVYISMTNPAGTSVLGSNTFTVRLDNPNVIDELDETNNSTTFTYNFLNGGVTLLQPTEFAIVNRATVRLVGQSNLPQLQPINYEFELDTIPTFTSAFRRQSGPVSGRDIASWTTTLPTAGRDSLVYYWRFRFSPATAPAGLDVTWANSSFRFINGSPGGWSQSHYGQMARNEKSRVTQSAPSGRWEFDARTRTVQLSTKGAPDANPTFQLSNGIIVDNQPVRVDNCGVYNGVTVRSPNIMVAVFEGRNLRQLNSLPGGAYSTCGAVGSITYFHFASTYDRSLDSLTDNINTARRQGQLLQLLRNVPNGAYVALLTINKVNYSSFSPALKAELQALGSQLIGSAQDGDPLAMVLHKGFPADRREVTFSPSNPIPRNEQAISLADTLRTREGSGTVTSTLIGPAQRWQTLFHTVKLPEPLADSDTLNLIGYTRNNTRVVLRRNVQPRNGIYSLTNVDANTYPYLQLQMVLRDTTNRTAPQLKQWLVTYQGVPEGVVRRDHPSIPNGAYDAATLSAAAASTGMLNIPVYFENVSPISFSALTRAKAIVTETSSGRPDTVSIRASRVAGFSRRPGADSTAVYNFRLNVSAVRGAATIRIIANSQELPEQVYYNNELNLSFTAPNITVPPVLDVAFDGTHILNGDIVSPNPEVLVEVRYEDKRRPLTDPSKVQLLLTRPGSTVPETVPMTNSALVRLVNDSTAGRTRVYYTPGTLPDGVYRLEVQAKDMGDNAAAAQRYGVTFEVVNKTSITHVFPYPNPITSTARFVFTLTGSTPPRNLKIQILTVSGKVVREILQNELGPLRIGNNVTSYAWDGTDEYGARLANGTYLYRVVLDDPEGQVEHRRTAADRAFHNGWGKLVLLR
ncbi:C25 family cysteine peptidase [Hymenobacter sp. 15J16-1T3B]|uniref:putative type IX secretion system sortase PorU2 n=1 Tax=Hymenobacter sp. 15J16-1T3B TaxID=2886941 RepID=UPI001D102367|nr:C25 family cysteine peptidase [Hymenobacter sp. 15J16-1T3B]MCC3159458.1 C25 family cysteine peptidase [Hymenobacter sp. 15J16-1T3B]